MTRLLRSTLTLLLSVSVVGVTEQSAEACMNEVRKADPRVKFIERVSVKLQRGDRRRACNQVLRKYTLNRHPSGYVAKWKGRLPRLNTVVDPWAPAIKSKRTPGKLKPVPRFDTEPGTLVYAYCVLTETSAFKKANKNKPGDAPLRDWALGVLKARSARGTSVDIARLAEVLQSRGSSEAKSLLSEMAAARTLPSAHAWLTWARIHKAEGKDDEAKKAVKNCKRLAKSKRVCRL